MCDTVQMLLRLGVDVNHITEYGTTALTQAASRRLSLVARQLLDAGARPEFDTTRETPLVCAMDAGAFDICDMVLAAGAHVDKETEGGLTALSIACIEGNVDGVKYLLRHGANPDYRGRNFSCPAILAATKDHAEALQLLIERGCVLEWENELNTTPLVRCAWRSADGARAEAVANVSWSCRGSWPVPGGCVSEQLSQSHGHVAQSRSQRRRNVRVRPDSSYGSDTGTVRHLGPLLQASPRPRSHHRVLATPQFSRLEAMAKLLKHKANPNVESHSTSSTALIQAIKIRNHDAVKLLLKHGASASQVCT